MKRQKNIFANICNPIIALLYIFANMCSTKSSDVDPVPSLPLEAILSAHQYDHRGSRSADSTWSETSQLVYFGPSWEQVSIQKSTKTSPKVSKRPKICHTSRYDSCWFDRTVSPVETVSVPDCQKWLGLRLYKDAVDTLQQVLEEKRVEQMAKSLADAATRGDLETLYGLLQAEAVEKSSEKSSDLGAPNNAGKKHRSLPKLRWAGEKCSFFGSLMTFPDYIFPSMSTWMRHVTWARAFTYCIS